MVSGKSLHVLTIDVEDWFHCLEPRINQWDQFVRRADVETNSLLELLNKFETKATFFVLGDVAQKSPDLIRKIASQGHEIGTHGMFHQFIYRQTKDEFHDDLRRSMELLSSITGTSIQSYRAPYFFNHF